MENMHKSLLLWIQQWLLRYQKHKQEDKMVKLIGFYQIQKLRASKVIMKTVKRQPMKWENIFAKHIFNRLW